jgi:hypothetical protein
MAQPGTWPLCPLPPLLKPPVSAIVDFQRYDVGHLHSRLLPPLGCLLGQLRLPLLLEEQLHPWAGAGTQAEADEGRWAQLELEASWCQAGRPPSRLLGVAAMLPACCCMAAMSGNHMQCSKPSPACLLDVGEPEPNPPSNGLQGQ